MPDVFNDVPKNAKDNPLLKLDVVLIFLHANDNYMQTLDEIQKGVYEHIGSEDNEIALILGKLEKDDYVMRQSILTTKQIGKFTSQVYENQFNITFNGKIFLKQGGYNLQDMRFREQNTRLETLETAQRANQALTTWLTVLIAVGTLIAATYYGIEIYKEVHAFFRAHEKYWIWETIPNN